MKIEILKTNLKKALDIIEKITRKNLTLPALSNVLLSVDGNFLRLDATNLEISVSWWILAKTEEKGKVAIPATFFSNLVNLLTDENIKNHLHRLLISLLFLKLGQRYQVYIFLLKKIY